jgi:hypothetical protein
MPTTTATPQRVKGMMAVSKNSGVKPLGYVVWFSVPDEDVSIRKLRSSWGAAGLEMSVLPRDQKAVNAFQRAVRQQEGVFRDEQAGTIMETDVRLVVETEQDIVYQISRVVRDLNERQVDYPKALKVWFNKETEDLQYRVMGETRKMDVLPIMDAIQDAYEAAGRSVTGSKVRTLVRNFIRETPYEGWRDDDGNVHGQVFGLSGENLRGKAGGVYFVLAKHERELESLAEFLHELYAPKGRAYLHIIPMADGRGERELIRAHHVANTVDEVDTAINEARNLLRADRDRAVRENVVKHHASRLYRMQARAAEYSKVLQEEQEDMAERIELLRRQLRKLGDI